MFLYFSDKILKATVHAGLVKKVVKVMVDALTDIDSGGE